MKNFTPINILISIFIMGFILCPNVYPNESNNIPYWKVIMAEAVSEGYDGMYAVACVIRNRGGDLKGFSGAKREDLDEFCESQGAGYMTLAKTIENMVFNESSEDITQGASHFENINKYGTPYWAKDMVKTVQIGKHTFFKQKHKI